MNLGCLGFDVPDSKLSTRNVSDRETGIKPYGSWNSEYDLRGFKMLKTEFMPSQKMLCFNQTCSAPHTRNAGNMSMRGPFTPSQWMELEHQALIYKYIAANMAIPSNLIFPIKRALVGSSGGISPFPVGWGSLRLGFSSGDPEPGRCRRTDGKKWRCSREAFEDQKYCERHMNRGRHRSRKPVESRTNHKKLPRPVSEPTSIPFPPPTKPIPLQQNQFSIQNQQLSFPEFGHVSSDSLLNPSHKPPHPFHRFMDDWPRDPIELGLGHSIKETNVKESNWGSVGGPLGEVLHQTNGYGTERETKNSSALNLMAESWSMGLELGESPTGVLHEAVLSNSSSGSSPSNNLVIQASHV